MANWVNCNTKNCKTLGTKPLLFGNVHYYYCSICYNKLYSKMKTKESFGTKQKKQTKFGSV